MNRPKLIYTMSLYNTKNKAASGVTRIERKNVSIKSCFLIKPKKLTITAPTMYAINKIPIITKLYFEL